MTEVFDTSKVTFGYWIPQRSALFGAGTVREIVNYGARAEESGMFDAVWLGDALTSKTRPEVITCLATIAGMTERVKLAVGCMASFAVRDPALFALQWATLDQVSNGRTLLSVCNGFQAGGLSAKEGEFFGGIPDKERPARIEENIELVRRLWSGEPVDFDGKFRQYAGIQIEPRPIQDLPPIWITANPPPGKNTTRVLRRVAKYGDGFHGGVSGDDGLEELYGYLREFGKDPSTFPIAGGGGGVNIGPDRAECINDSAKFYDAYYGPGFIDPETTVAGTAEQCAEQLLARIGPGTTHVPIRIVSLEPERHFDAFVNEVMPAVIAGAASIDPHRVAT